MDWGRAKTILIVSFLFLNMLLGYQLWVIRWDEAHALSDTAVIVEEANKILESKQIRLEAEVPKDAPKLKAINYKEKFNTAQPKMLVSPLNAVNILGRNTLKESLAKAGVEKPGEYQLDKAVSRGGLQVLNQMHGDLPMFDVTLALIEESGKITGYKQSYVEVQSGGDLKEQKVISAYTALRSMAEGVLAEKSVITDIRLGYHGQRFDSETQYMLPCWRFVLSDGQVYYVQGFNGAVESASDNKN